MENLKTFFKKSNLKFGGRLFGFGTSPEADWKVIFTISILLALGVVIFSIFIFIKIDKGEIFVSEESSREKTEVLDTTLLKETVSYYQNKALEFEEAKNSRISTVDPSL